ncbi:hypothetical protein [Colwellia sp. 12G3]|uniref:hypothetical protein n=1 Tax=Colwellia sp. 12G3 TaxID=2058299 RepID=UPI0018E3D5CA|nr:hypothetical protein [Colwellia sp. 12G3]
MIYNNENNMVDKSKLSKDVEEQIQSLASDVYIQVEDKITNLIAAAVKAEISQTTDQQSKNSSENERVLANDINLLKQQLAEKQVDADIHKQNFQVELTQNSINYTETIERLEKDIANLKQQETQQQGKQQNNDHKLEEKLLETEQKLNDRTQAIDGLNGRIMVLTEQEHSLTNQLKVAKEQIQLSDKKQNDALTANKVQVEASAKQQIDALTAKIQLNEKQQNETVTAIKAQAEASAKQQIDVLTEKLKLSDQQQNEAVTAIKTQAEASTKQQIDALTEKLQQLESESARIRAETLQSSDSTVKGLEQKVSQLAEQVQQEQNGKAELQQQLSAQQKSIDTEQDKNRQAEQKSQDYQSQIIKLTEQAAIEKQQLLDEIKSINEGAEKIKQLHLDEIKAINDGAEKTKQLHLDEIKAINDAGEQVKQLQATAQQSIIELEKANEQLSKKVEIEQNDIKLYQQEVTVLNDQVKVAQEGQENILNRFNTNRDKQEVENDKVRETIKFLRDENHQLISDNNEQKAQFNEQINELEHKLTEYRLKFEYAQKQLTS